MQAEDGHIRRLTDEAPLRRASEVVIPEADEERLLNASRQVRRAWARKQLRAQHAADFEAWRAKRANAGAVRGDDRPCRPTRAG